MGVTPKKQAVVSEIKNWLTTSQAVILTSYRGLNVATDTEMRRELRAAGVTYKVVKNTMLRIAAKEAGIEGLDSHLEGTTAIAFSAEDAVAPAKVLCGFMKKNKLEDQGILTIKVGILDGKVRERSQSSCKLAESRGTYRETPWQHERSDCQHCRRTFRHYSQLCRRCRGLPREEGKRICRLKSFAA